VEVLRCLEYVRDVLHLAALFFDYDFAIINVDDVLLVVVFVGLGEDEERGHVDQLNRRHTAEYQRLDPLVHELNDHFHARVLEYL